MTTQKRPKKPKLVPKHPQNPRMMLTIPPSLRETLGRLGAALEKPMATVTVDFLKEMQPVLEMAAQTAIHTRAGNDKAARQVLAQFIVDAMADEDAPLLGKGRSE